MNDDATAAVLGAGISGLSTAYALKKRGIDVVVYEKNRHAGGVIQTHRENDWLVEKGPNTMLVRDQKIWNLLDELKLTNRILKPGPEAKKRYVVRGGRLIPVPASFMEFLKTDLFSAPAKFRLLKEPFISKSRQQDETIASFVRRRLGTEVLDYAVNPFVSGIYAGNPELLSIKHTLTSLFEMEQAYGSIFNGLLKRKKEKHSIKKALISFDTGLQLLPQTIAKELKDSIRFNTKIRQILPGSSGFKLQLKNENKTFSSNHRVLISTLPAHQLPGIWRDNQSRQLAEIAYAPMSVLALGFRQNQIRHPLDGFGMLIPEKEPFSLLGCLFSSSLFNPRAPDDHVLLTGFMGGALHPELAAQSTESLITEMMPQLQTLLGVQGKPVFQHHTFWPQAIPQYSVGYKKHLKAIEHTEVAHPGFFLTGNYRGGVSIPDCILNGMETAKRVEKLL